MCLVDRKPQTHALLVFCATLRHHTMMYDEFKSILKEARIPVKTLAAILDMNPTSITNYRRKGVVPRHLAVIATLMGVLSAQRISAKEILSTYQQQKLR